MKVVDTLKRAIKETTIIVHLGLGINCFREDINMLNLHKSGKKEIYVFWGLKIS